ncbi:hypothetical protein OAQ99_02195 [Candidatus Kapabacteria bacterium]|nr:hypothetical protein [Candidatus Kapabacteria bacterium]
MSAFSYSQEIKKNTSSIGIFGIIGNSNHSSNIIDDDLPELNYCCPNFKKGNGFSWEFGASIRLPITRDISLNVRPSIRDISGILTNKESLERVNVNGKPEVGFSNHTLDTQILTGGMTFLLSYEPIYLININLGLRYSYILNAGFSYKESIVSPANAIFVENGTKTRNRQDGNFSNLNKHLFSTEMSISYGIPLNNQESKLIVPEIYYSIGMSDLIKNIDWNIDFLGIGLSYIYKFRNKTNLNSSPIKPD